jgi:membrane protease YdiL (CAAX protease family)
MVITVLTQSLRTMNLTRIDSRWPEAAIDPTGSWARSGSILRGAPRDAIQSGSSDRIRAPHSQLSPTAARTHTEAMEALAQAKRIRELMGHFLINIIVIMCFYAVIVAGSSCLAYDVGITILISAGLLMGLALAAISIVLKRGTQSLRFYGLTNCQWRKQIINSVLYSLPIVAAIVLAKWIVIQLLPSLCSLDLFSGRLTQYPLQTRYLIELAVYIALIPVQEFVARGVLQGSLQEFLTGRHGTLKAILLSNLLFATFHLFVSPYFAMATFLLGIFWGWLYSRQRSLIGVIASHTLIGVWALYFVGTHGILMGTPG